jgi:hypothetical protein
LHRRASIANEPAAVAALCKIPPVEQATHVFLGAQRGHAMARAAMHVDAGPP